MGRTEPYRGFEISWQEPPATSAGFSISIASNNIALQRALEAYAGGKGAHTFMANNDLEQLLREAKLYVDAVMPLPSS